MSCTEYLTLHAARERERVSLDGNATTRTAAENFSKKNFLKNLVVPEILLNFADATDNKNGSKFFEKL